MLQIYSALPKWFRPHAVAEPAQLRRANDAAALHHLTQINTRLNHLAEHAVDLYWETDTKGLVIANGGRLLPSIANEQTPLIGRHYLEIVDLEPAEAQKMAGALAKLAPYSDIQASCQTLDDAKIYLSLSATPRFDESGHVTGYLGVANDITDRVKANRELRFMAEHDMLTGLANRYLFSTRLSRQFQTATSKAPIAFIAIDLDGFKDVNDLFGHDAGDALLKIVAKRLRQTIRDHDWAARLGGDEFVIIASNLNAANDALSIAERVRKALAKPYQIGGVSLPVSASIGLATAPFDAATIDQLMKCADIALYRAKEAGKNRICVFNSQGLPQATAELLDT
jgi:diguanylate cyclase (GGDEF)-like protein/PAS domain S-box-containing protein